MTSSSEALHRSRNYPGSCRRDRKEAWADCCNRTFVRSLADCNLPEVRNRADWDILEDLPDCSGRTAPSYSVEPAEPDHSLARHFEAQ